MKYIGNKTRVLDFIEESLIESGINYKQKRVVDLFAGTGSVSNFFLKNRCEVFSCDNMTYSICEQYRVNYFTKEPLFTELSKIVGGDKLDDVLNYLNCLPGVKGYYYLNYAPSGKYKRQYFSDSNAQKIDAIRLKISEWREVLDYSKYMYLVGILMCAADRISNTSGTYGAYLKVWRSMALKDIYLEKPDITSKGKNYIYQDDVNEFIKGQSDIDIVYLDPPYNERQYASNFHVLENIVVDDKQELNGKTGLRNYEKQKSDYCQKSKVIKSFTDLISNCDCKYIVMSYSSEGLMSENEIIDILSKKGKVEVYKKDYRRFKTNAWTNKNTGLQEIIFICKIS